MYFFAAQQNVNLMQLQQWSTPFAGCGLSGQFTPPQFPQFPSCPPNINGGNIFGEVSSFWSQAMQAHQSLFEGWQQFGGCAGSCRPPQIHHHHHHHYHYDQPQQSLPQPAPLPAPTPLPAPAPAPTPAPAFPAPVVVAPPAPVAPRPLPRPPVQTGASPFSFGGLGAASGVRVFGTSPTRPGLDTQLPGGQSIEDMFNNPFQGQEYLKDALDTISAVRNVYGVQPARTPGQKGDLRVIAGDRYDGVKPREVRIDDVNSYDYQKGENSYQENRQEVRFKDGTIGREYDVTVTWEDGTSTLKRVQLREAGQIVYISSAEGY